MRVGLVYFLPDPTVCRPNKAITDGDSHSVLLGVSTSGVPGGCPEAHGVISLLGQKRKSSDQDLKHSSAEPRKVETN